MIYDDYVNYCDIYKKKYGKVVVFMEVGSFFEFYAVEKDGEFEGSNIYEICSILNIQSTRKNKSILECSRNNPLMAGFPTYSLQKFIEILLPENYTIVLVEQVTPPPNPERAVTKIISSSTFIESVSTNSYLMCMYISTYQKDQFILSITFMDITTGETFIFDDEIKGDRLKICQEINRISLLYSPSELVMIGEQFPYSSYYIDHTKNNISMFKSVSYQNAILTKVYNETGLLSPIEYIDLEKRHDALTNFVYLINFAYEHNELIIKKLQKPKIINTSSHLRLMNSCVEHLSIIPKQGSPSSLLQLLNTCDTSIGKRYFKEALLNPLCDITEIEKRYEWTFKLIPHINLYRPFLKTIKDVQRLFRKILLGILQPSEMSFISSSLQSLESVQNLLKEHVDFIPINFQPFIEMYEKKWDIEKMSTHIHFYKNGIHSCLDECLEKIESLHAYFENIVKESNKLIGDTFFKLELTNERQDYQILITSKRYETYCKKVSNNKFTSQPLSSSNKTMLKLNFEGMYNKQQELHHLTSELKTLVKEQYLKDLEQFQSFSEMMEDIVKLIGTIDFHVTCAKNAVNHNYIRPSIIGTESMIHAKKVRHPLIEVFQKDLPYIPNDVHLEKGGILLYGINSAGKSSYMKSVGLNLIMAQAGMFVASETFEYSPYDHIFTRIPGGDNLFKGQSTFVAEISELRSILKYSTSRSLIIGDEIASGTESVSGISIVSSGIISLCNRNASFIFATHLHEVAQLESVKRIENLGIFHISVHYDENKKILIYDRILKEGSGETMYGLEVCKSLDMPSDFLHLANTIRQEYLQLSKTVVEMKQSRYSSQVFVDTCSICKNKAEEVHHIQEQMLADKHGFIGSIHKNDKHNLIAICEKCHDEIHNGSIKVEGFKQTSMGKMLITEDTKMIKDSINQFDLVSSMRKEGKSLKTISKELGMTLYQVNKILKN